MKMKLNQILKKYPKASKLIDKFLESDCCNEDESRGQNKKK